MQKRLLTRVRAIHIWLMAPLLGAAMVLAILLSSSAPLANAITADNTLNFQARLYTSTGAIVPDGNYNIDFKIYNADSTTGTVGTCTGACLWEETWTNAGGHGIPVVNGYFSVRLNSINNNWSNATNWDQQYYLTMNVTTNGTQVGAPISTDWNGEMQNGGHSIALTAVPLAFKANSLAVNNGTQTGTLSFGSVTNSPVITLPNETGTVCTSAASSPATCTDFAAASGSGNYIQNSTGGPQTANYNIISAANTSIGAIVHANASQSVDIFDVQSSASTVFFGVNSNGTTVSLGATNPTISASATNSNLSVNANGTGTLNLNNTGTANTTQIGNTSGAVNGIINLGTNAISGATNTIHVGDAATSTDTITIGSNSNVNDSVNIEAGNTGKVQIGNTNVAHTVQIGAGGTSTNQAVTVGSNNAGASTLLLQGGNGTGGSAAIKIQPNAAGDVAIGGAATTGAIILGASGETGQITIGQATTATTQTISIESANSTGSSQTVEIGGGSSTTSGGKTVNIANGTPGLGTNNAINIGTGGNTAGTVNITIGSNGAVGHTTIIQGGNGTGASAAIRLQPNAAGDVLIGGADTTGAITLGASTQSGTINIGQTSASSTNQTINIGAVTGASSTETLNLGTSSTATSTTNLVIGSTVAGTTTLQSAGGVKVSTLGAVTSNSQALCRDTSSNTLTACDSGSGGLPFIQNGNSFGAPAVLGTNDSNSLSFETSNSTQVTIAVGGATTFQNSADSSTAFNIKNTGGTAVLSADTTNLGLNATNLQATGTIALQGPDGGSILLRTAANSGPAGSGSNAMTLSGYEITDATRSINIQGDGRQPPDNSIGIWESTTNLVTNGGFENNTTGWIATTVAGGTPSISSTAIDSKFGSHSMQLLSSTAGTLNAARYSSTFATSTTYTASAWIKVASGAGATNLLWLATYNSPQVTSQTALTADGKWHRYSVTFTTDSTSQTSDYLDVRVSGTPTTQYDIRIDGVQLEQKSLATPYVDTNGSTATRNGAGITAPVAALGTPTQGWVAVRLRLGFNMPYPGANWPGIFDWGGIDTNSIQAYFSPGSNNLTLRRTATGGTGTNTVQTSMAGYTAGQIVTLVFAWTSNQLAVSVNGGSFVTATPGATQTPTLAATSFGIGTRNGATSNQVDSDILWLSAGAGPLTNTDTLNLYRLGNSDPTLSGLTAMDAAVSPTFAWDGESNQYSGVNNSPALQSGISIDDTSIYHNAAGSLAIQGGVNSTTTFQVQNSSGTSLLTVDTTNSQVVLGSPSTQTGKLAFANSSGANTIAIVGPAANPGGSYTITIPTLVGNANLCVDTSNGNSVCSGYAPASGSGNYIQNQVAALQVANFKIQSSATSSVGATIQGANGQTADLLDLINGTTSSTVVAVSSGTANTAGTNVVAVNGTSNTTGSSTQTGLSSNLVATPGSASTATFQGIYASGSSQTSNTSGAIVIGGTFQAAATNGGNVGTAVGVSITNVSANLGGGAATIANSYGVQVTNPTKVSSTITKNAGVNVDNQSNGTNNTNLLLGTTTIPTGNYSIYNSSAYANFFGGTLQVEPSSNSTMAFQVQNAAGSQILGIDTTAGNGNLVTNGDFEVNATGWTSKGTSTAPASTTAQAYQGTQSGTTTVSAASSGMQYNYTFGASTQYQLTFYARCSATIATFTYGRQDNGSDINNTTTATCSSTGWTAFTWHFTTGATIGTSNIYMTEGTTTSGTIYIDAVTLIQTATSAFNPYENGAIQVNGVINTPTTIMPTSNSTNVFNVENTTGTTSELNVDTLNNRVNIVLPTTSSYGANLNVGGTTTTRSNSTTALQVQSSNGNLSDILAVDTSTTNNLITNSDFEANGTTGWAVKNGSTLSRVTTQQWQGNGSLQVAGSASNNSGTSYNFTMSTGTQYTLSLYAKVASGSISDFIIGRQDVSGTDVLCFSGTNQTLTTSWKRFVCTFTTGGTITNSNIFAQKTGSSAETFFIDGVQLQTGGSASAYNPGGGIMLEGLVNSPVAFQNKNDSTTALQVQSAGGANVLSIDTLDSLTSVQGTNSNAVLGSELAGSIACSGTNWAGSGTGPWTHTIGSTVALSCNPPSITAGTNYVYYFSIGGSPTAGSVTPSIGGQSGDVVYYYDGQTYQFWTSVNTNNFTITPTTDFNGSISSVSIKVLTQANPVLAVNNSDGTTGIEIRSGGSGLGNSFIGLGAGYGDTSGQRNTAVGAYSLDSNTTANDNTALGYSSLLNNVTGFGNTALGSDTLVYNNGSYNTAVGQDALQYNTTGFNNTVVGNSALLLNTGGSYNAVFGAAALQNNTTGNDNVVVGYNSATSNTTGHDNTVLGTSSFTNNISGTYNVALGNFALDSQSTGDFNVGVGYQAGDSINGGSYNSFLGYNAGANDPIVSSFDTPSNLQKAVGIGYGSVVQESGAIILGGVGSTGTSLLPNVGIGTTSPDNTFSISPDIYDTGTASMSGTATITGSGTSWQTTGGQKPAAGMDFIFANGDKYKILSVNSDTSITATTTGTESSQSYRIHNPAFYITATGQAELRTSTNSTTAFQVQTASGTSVLTVDTTNAAVNIAGSIATQHGTDISTTGNLNNLNVGGASLIRLTGSSTQTVTGIANGRDGYQLTIVNAGSSVAILKNNDSTDSSAANVIITGTGADLNLAINGTVNLIYDSQYNSGVGAWRAIAGGSGSGGTSSNFQAAYVEQTSNVTVNAGSASAVTVVTATPITADGSTAYNIEFFSPNVNPAANDFIGFALYQDGSPIGVLGSIAASTTTGNGDNNAEHLSRVFTPSAGTHTYAVKAYRNASNGTVSCNLGGSGVAFPCYIRITLANPSFGGSGSGSGSMQLDYASITSGVSTTATSEGTATTAISGNSISYDGTQVRIEVWAPNITYNGINGSDPNSILKGVLFRDSTPIGQFDLANSTTTVAGTIVRGAGQAVDAIFYDTPSSGSHTYVFKEFATAISNGISWTLNAGNGTTGNLAPAFLSVTRLNPLGGAGGSYIQNGTTTQTANFNVQSASSSSVTAVIQGASSQSVDILDVKDSSTNVLLGVDQNGNVSAKGNIGFTSTGNANQAFTVNENITGTVTAGDVVVIDTSNAGYVTDSSTANSTQVVGIATKSQTGGSEPIVISGIYQVNVTGTITIGDYLVTSSTAGTAQDTTSPSGGIVGQAMSTASSSKAWALIKPQSGAGGGSSGSGSRYELMESDWFDTGATLPSAATISQSATVTVGNYVYLIGGLVTGTTTSRSVWQAPVSNPTSFTLISSTALPAGIAGGQVAIIGSTVYYFGGTTTGANAGATNVIYSTPTSSIGTATAWTNAGTISGASTGVAYSQLAIIGSTVYLFGGTSTAGDNGAICSTSTSNPVSGWSCGGALGFNLAKSQLAVIGGYVYLFGGESATTPTFTNAIYRAAVATPTSWTTLAETLPQAIGRAQLLVVGDYVYLFGGTNGTANNFIYKASVNNPVVWNYDGGNGNSNTVRVPPATSLIDSAAAIVGNAAYLFAGNINGTIGGNIYSAPIVNGSPDLSSNPSWKVDQSGAGSGSGTSSQTANGNYQLDYQQITSNVTGINNTGKTVITGNSVTYDGGTSVEVQFFTPYISPGAYNGNSSAYIVLSLYEDGSSIGQIGESCSVYAAGTSPQVGCDGGVYSTILTPSAGAHTFSIYAGGGLVTSGTIYAGGSYLPAYIRVVRANPNIQGGSGINNGTTTQTANFNIQSSNASNVTAVIQGAVSQSADILEVKDSSSNNLFRVDSSGNTFTKGNIGFANTGNANQALTINMIVTSSVNAGDVVVIDTSNPGQATDSAAANSTQVVGIATQNQSAGQPQPIVISGVYQVNVTGAVTVGDYLVTSSTTGTAQDTTSPSGGVIGQAMSTASSGKAWTLIKPQSGAGSGSGSGGNGIMAVVTYTSGSGTFTVPYGVTAIQVEAVGGGGGGGASTVNSWGAGGGGGGGYARKLITSPVSSYSYSVGGGGNAGSGTAGTAGTGGGNTTFGSITANGGSGNSAYGGGAGGTSSGGDVNTTGQVGANAAAGGSANGQGGNGGSSVLGGGGAGGTTGTTLAGSAGNNYGGGGGGAASYSSFSAGGAGAGGVIVITEYGSTGSSSSGSSSSSNNYELMESDWTNTGATLPTNLDSSNASVTISNTIYFYGGGDASATNKIYSAPVSNPTYVTDTGHILPGNLSVSSVAIVGSSIYIFGGYNGTSATNVIYTATTSAPTTVTSTGSTLPGNLAASSLAIIGNYIYLFGGFTGAWATTFTNVIYKASLSAPTSWSTATGTIPTAIAYSSLAVIGTYVYLFGGYNGSASGSIWRASTSNPGGTGTGAWANMAGYGLPAGIAGSSLAIVGNYIYLMGGTNGSSSQSVVYRAAVNSPLVWGNAGETLPGALSYSSEVIAGNALYLYGGSGTNVIYSAPIVNPSPDLTSNPSWKVDQNTGGSSGTSSSSSSSSYQLDYAQITSPVTSITTDKLVVSGNSVTYDGNTKVEVQFYSPENLMPSSTGESFTLKLYEDGSSIGNLAVCGYSATANINSTCNGLMTYLLTPSAGSHTFAIYANSSISSATVEAGNPGSGNYMPAYIRIVQANPTFQSSSSSSSSGSSGNYRLDYQQITSNATVTTTESTVITGNSVTYDGSQVQLTAYFGRSYQSGGSGSGQLWGEFYRDTTNLGQFFCGNDSANHRPDCYGSFYDTPSAGAHTYYIKAYTTSGTAPVDTIECGTGGATTALPCYLLVTRANPSFQGGSGINNGTTTQTANFNIQSVNASSVTATIQGASSQSADILDVKDGSGNILFGVAPTGVITLGPASATPDILVLGTKNTTGDPGSCTAGGVYYNSADNLFRGCANNTWQTLNGMTKIADINLSGSAASFDVTSIPAIYSSLRVQFYVRGTNASNSVNCNLRFNNDSASHYLYYYARAQSGGAYLGSGTTQGTPIAQILLSNECHASTSTAGLYDAFTIDIPNYANTVGDKVINFTNTGGPNEEAGAGGGWWESTSAINEITLTPSAGSWATGSRAIVWGMP